MSGASQGSQAYSGWQAPSDSANIQALIRFIVQQELGHHRSAVPVKILAVNGGGVGAAPTVDVQIMVKQTDSVGNTSSHSTIYGIPVARNQGGSSAIINDPKVGDVGHMVVSDRDISSVKANAGAESNPGSYRRHDLADGVYHAAMLNKAAPTQYVQFLDNGVKIIDKNGNITLMDTTGITFTDKSGNIVLMDSTGISVKPASGLLVKLGNPADGTLSPVVTVAGPDPHVQAYV